MTRLNQYGQAIGQPLPHWSSRPRPPHSAIAGQFCRLEPVSAHRHGAELFAANTAGPDARSWTYLPTEPFTSEAEFHAYLTLIETSLDPLFFCVIDQRTKRAVGMLALMRIDPVYGVVEVGNIHYSPLIQHTPAGTEAIYLLMQLAFALGYRRLEWKCDSLNQPSRSAARRLGFSFEGIFRQALVYKGRSRDTAWFSIIDSEWPAIQAAMQAWLAPDNFEPDGQQRMPLADIRQQLAAEIPA